MSLDIIYSDSDFYILNKPAGIVVEPSQTQRSDTIADILIKEYGSKLPRGGIVHRLDKDTSGILLVAKTQEALENLQAQFKERTTKKEYVSLVHGLIEKGGQISGAIARNPGDREKFMVDSSGKEALTRYEVLARLEMTAATLTEIFAGFNKIQMRKLNRSGYGKFSLLQVYPETGRTHQIRVHLKYIGFPVVGDEKYAGRKKSRLDHRWCPRQFLHAGRISFKHPRSGEVVSFTASLPADLEKALMLLTNV